MHETTIATNVGMLSEATSDTYDGPTRGWKINEKLINVLNIHKKLI